MPLSFPVPRKRRTRQHVIADQGVNFVERFVFDEGHTAQRSQYDYGYDLHLITYDAQGYVEPGSVYVQIKAAETLEQLGTTLVFDLDLRDFHLWRFEPMPVFLVLFDASHRRAYWLYVQHYFAEDQARRNPRKGSKTVRVRIPNDKILNRRAIRAMRVCKQQALSRMRRKAKHV